MSELNITEVESGIASYKYVCITKIEQEINTNFFRLFDVYLCEERSYQEFNESIFKTQNSTFLIHGVKILPGHGFNVI